MSVKAFRLDLTPEQAAALAEELQGLVEIGLDHPSIVMPLAAGLEGHTVYLAEEYVAAESLDIALRHYAPAALETALPFLSQLAGAIDVARARGVGHGALHPRDIFLAPEIARATGFGIVQALERLGLRAPVRRPYSAPERVSGATWSTPADVFALGAVAHELLTGKRPAGTGEVAPIAGKAAESHAARLRAVLGGALAEDPAARFTSAKALVAALEAAAWHEEPVPAAAESIRELEVELDRDAAPAPEPGDFDIRPTDEDETFEPRHRELGHDREEQPVHEEGPGKDTEPAPGVVVPRKESLRRTSVSRRRKRHEEPAVARGPEIAEKEAPQQRQIADEPSLFDLAEQATPAGGVAVPGRHEFEDEAQDSDLCVEEREPVDDILAPSERGYVPVEPVAAFPHAPYPPAAERSRAAILPFAIVATVSLLAGFLAGYALGSREQKPAATESAQSAPRTEPSSPSAPRATAPKPAPISPAASLPVPSLSSGSSRSKAAAPRQTPAPPAATTGTLVADSRPSGARVIVDGRAVGKTPLKLGGIKAGSHAVRFELEGYRAWTAGVTVTGGRETRVAGSLERARNR